MELSDALRTRRSVRAFRPDPVPRATVEALLAEAALAPSGTNVQPWKVHVVAGATRDRLVAEVLAHREANPADAAPEFPRSAKRKEPYVTRMRTLGKAMYGLIGIPKGDAAANWAQWGRNYKFFDAPVGLIFTVDRVMEQGSWLDYGMFLENIMIAARGRGLDTCAQAAFTPYHRLIAEELDLGAGEMVVCGMALGRADPDAIENRLVTERAPVAEFTRFHD